MTDHPYPESRTIGGIDASTINVGPGADDEATLADEALDLLRRALKDHDAIASALRTGIGNQRLFRAIDDMRAVKEQAAAMGCYKASVAAPPTPEPQP